MNLSSFLHLFHRILESVLTVRNLAPLYKEGDFHVLIGIQRILAGTSLELDPLAIIRLYSLRSRIERAFRELKQQIGAFCYHFWSKLLPKLNDYQEKGSPSPMERVKNGAARENIKKTICTIEMHMLLACIASVL